MGSLRRSGAGLMVCIAALMVTPPPAAAVSDDAFQAVPGELANVSVRVKHIHPRRKGFVATLVDLEVSNRGAVAVEPLAFEVEGAGRKGASVLATQVIRRASASAVFGRGGRAAPGGGKAVFTVQVAAELPRRAKLAARVTKASFFVGDPIETAPVRIDGMEVVQVANALGAGKVDATRIRLVNLRDQPVDVTFIATYAAPLKGKGVVGFTLAPNEELAREVSGLSPHGPWGPGSGGGRVGAKITNLDIVDWSVVRSPGREEATDLLRSAWLRWFRWGRPSPGVGGALTYRFGPSDSNQSGTAEFSVPPQGQVRVVPAKALEERLRTRLVNAVAEAFADLRHPTFDEFAAGHDLRLVELGERSRIAATGPGVTLAGGEQTVFDIQDDRIVASHTGLEPWHWHTSWTHEDAPGGYRPTSRALRMGSNTGVAVTTYAVEYGETDGLATPKAVRIETDNSLIPDESLSVRFTKIEPGAERPERQVLPTGRVADALRAAWQAFYRYPDAPSDRVVGFEISNDGSSDMWTGARRVTGTVVLRGFTGRSWTSAEFDFDGEMTETLRERLTSVTEGRMRMWPARDICDSPPFDVAFLGATLRPDSADKSLIHIENGPFRSVRLANGRLMAVADEAGERTLKHRRTHDALVPVSSVAGEAEVLVEWARVDSRWVLPKRIELRNVLGPDFGTEVLTYRWN